MKKQLQNQSKKLSLLAVVALCFGAYFYFDLSATINLETIKAQQSALQLQYQQNQLLGLGSFFLLYATSTALSIPIATPMTLAAGAIFGFIPALILCSFASTLGASLAFLASRFLFFETIQSRYSEKLTTLNQGFEREGNYYLFFLRLAPIFPFFLINILMALTKISLSRYYVISQVGMLPATAAFVFAGTEIGNITSAADVISAKMIFAMALIGLLPLMGKKLAGKSKLKQN